ncbi:MAG: hypothetical protein MJD61_22280 [Proteobacteria bacterium]|nr:hypothetical protein [Pseudomonadota bacterium]
MPGWTWFSFDLDWRSEAHRSWFGRLLRVARLVQDDVDATRKLERGHQTVALVGDRGQLREPRLRP